MWLSGGWLSCYVTACLLYRQLTVEGLTRVSAFQYLVWYEAINKPEHNVNSFCLVCYPQLLVHNMNEMNVVFPAACQGASTVDINSRPAGQLACWQEVFGACRRGAPMDHSVPCSYQATKLEASPRQYHGYGQAFYAEHTGNVQCSSSGCLGSHDGLAGRYRLSMLATLAVSRMHIWMVRVTRLPARHSDWFKHWRVLDVGLRNHFAFL